jgi:hypothetical protein
LPDFGCIACNAAMRRPLARRHPVRSSCLAILTALLSFAACSGSSSSSFTGVAAEPVVGADDVLPGVVVTIEAVRGGPGLGRARVGDRLRVEFRVATDAGAPLELATMARGAIMVSGPTFHYQRVIASQSDLRERSFKRGLGLYTYDFVEPIPATYLPPYNDTAAITTGELTGQALLAGTYTVGIELRKDYVVGNETLRDPGNSTADFLLGGATTIESREVVTLANCNQCHTELRAHGSNRNNLTNCLLCHTAGAEDRNVASVAGGTPGASVDFKDMIHKIHSGKHLPSVLGVTTKPDGTRDYAATPKPYQLVGFGNQVHDYSDVTWPAWPSIYSPMPRDLGHTTLPSGQQAAENTMRQGPSECAKCHGDPDGDGPLPAPAQGDLIWSQPTIAGCISCHDDWVPDYPYTANGQTMPLQRDDAACTQCHRVEGAPLDVKDAHRHPLIDPAHVAGIKFLIDAVNDVGGTANGRFEAGERVQVTFRVTNDAGTSIAASSLTRVEPILGGPVNNPQLLTMVRIPPAVFSGSGPYTVNLPALEFYDPVGVSDGSLNTFTTSRQPVWNVSGAVPTLLRRTAATTSTTLTVGALPTNNWIDVASSAGFAKDDDLVIDDGLVGVREYMRVQYVEGNRIWFGSQYRTTYKPSLLRAHAIGAAVQKVTLAAVSSSLYSIDLPSGVITELSEIGDGEILAKYTTDFLVPAVYPGALGDTPTLGETWGDWTGLPLVSGTYTLQLHGAKSFAVTRSGETTNYTEGADSTTANLLFGTATSVEAVSRVDANACYGCHDSLQFHGGNRRSLEGCMSCHGTAGAQGRLRYDNPTTGTFDRSVEFRHYAHALHQPVFPGMPGGVQDCAKCHGSNTAWQVPDERLHPQQLAPTRAWYAACTGCHSDNPAKAHMDANTSIFGVESCAVCHGADDTLSVRNVHRVR